MKSEPLSWSGLLSSSRVVSPGKNIEKYCPLLRWQLYNFLYNFSYLMTPCSEKRCFVRVGIAGQTAWAHTQAYKPDTQLKKNNNLQINPSSAQLTVFSPAPQRHLCRSVERLMLQMHCGKNSHACVRQGRCCMWQLFEPLLYVFLNWCSFNPASNLLQGSRCALEAN